MNLSHKTFTHFGIFAMLFFHINFTNVTSVLNSQMSQPESVFNPPKFDNPELHRIATRQVGRIVNRVCANGGRYLKSLCITDYNCNRGFRNRAQECVRGFCCTKSQIQSSEVNRRRQIDEQNCRNGGFDMGQECKTIGDCNREDPYYNNRAFKFQVCSRNRCCSTVYRAPQSQGERCINGGAYLNRRCTSDVDCGSTNSNNIRERQTTVGTALCVQDSCCTRTEQDNLDEKYTTFDGNIENTPPADDYQRGRNVCRQQGYTEYTRRRCTARSECGSNTLDGAFYQVECISSYCCRYGSSPNPNPTPNNGGNDGEGDNPIAGDDGLPREAACQYLGYNLGTWCQTSPDCDRQTPAIIRQTSGTRRRVCVLAAGSTNGRCCSVPVYNPSGSTSLDPTNQKGGQVPAGGTTNQGGQVPAGVAHFCSTGGSFTKFTGRLCEPLYAAACPTVSVYDGQAVVQLPVRCIRGYCCSTKQQSSTTSGKQNDPQGNPTGPLPIRPQNSIALCYDGSESSQQCRSAAGCSGTNTICVQGLCCPTKQDHRNFVCGGLSAIGNCFANTQCNDELVCTASNYCCECHYGQPQPLIKCNTNVPCRSEYECTPRGYCCPRCADNLEPYGSCFSGKCASGFSCQLGNICCPNSSLLRV